MSRKVEHLQTDSLGRGIGTARRIKATMKVTFVTFRAEGAGEGAC
jgi:hypothetical protein